MVKTQPTIKHPKDSYMGCLLLNGDFPYVHLLTDAECRRVYIDFRRSLAPSSSCLSPGCLVPSSRHDPMHTAKCAKAWIVENMPRIKI